MDVTPRELRDIDISGEFRGYCRAEVNELLERAAATIEGLSERVRMLSDRLTAVQNDPGRREAVAEAPVETPNRALEMAQRTLEMAQKTADEELTRARESAQTMVRDAEIRVNSLVSEAEAEARRRSDTERRRLHDDVSHLAGQRDALRADVEALDRFESDYRDRLVRAIEADLAVVRGRGSAAPGPTPELTAAVAPSVALGAPTAPAALDAGTTEILVTAAPAAEATGTDIHEPITAEEVAIPPSPDEVAARIAHSTPDTGGGDAAGRNGDTVLPDDETVDLFAAESAERQVPDDAFFSSLRDAVRDDAPLGPDEERFFDDASRDPSLIRDVFRRRR